MQLALRASHTSQKVAHLSQKMWPSHGSQAGHHQKLSEVVPAHTAVFSRVIRLTRTPESYTEPEKVWLGKSRPEQSTRAHSHSICMFNIKA